MKLEALQDNWNKLGVADPLWAVVSHADKRHGGWDPDEFFATGCAEIDQTLAWIEASGLPVAGEAALDFGCGAGRLTQALARRFSQTTGVDIAESMLAVAEEFNHQPERCRFVHNPHPDLRVFDTASFDLVNTLIVLQHMEPRYIESYLREFVRVLRPGGVLVFQLPSQPVPTAKGQLRRLLAKPRLQPLLNLYRRVFQGRPGSMEMYGLSQERVRELLADAGAELRAVEECTSAGPTWISYRYLVTKPLGSTQT